MERNLIFDERPKFIEDLGSGYSNVHLDIKQVETEEYDINTKESRTVVKFTANVQRVKNPVTYDKTVDAAIREEFPDGADEAALRKGIINSLDKDFVRLNKFAESVKEMYKKSQSEANL